MARCQAIKANGERCRGSAAGPEGWCWSHDPENAAVRSRMASRAARSKPNGELADIKALLADLTNRVLADADADPLETARATAANQLINTRLRAVEVERRIRETDELQERINALERTLERREGDKDGVGSWAG